MTRSRKPEADTVRGRPSPAMVRRLLAWYDAHRRPLPWRIHPTPYTQWVAEVLLQQTRVDQAVPYYRRFVERFPDVRALAEASEQEVLKVWEGAGYYARARNLHRSARQIRDRFEGRLPRTWGELRTLPGVGDYIASAVAAIAYNEPRFPYDANAARVGARLLLERRPSGDREVRWRLRRWWAEGLPPARSGAFAESVMELGEVVCVPRRPKCHQCPLAPFCRARRFLPKPGVLPVRHPRRARPHVRAAVVAARLHGRFLVHRRPANGLLGGLWEFPGGKVVPGETVLAAARREFREETGFSPPALEFRGVVRHAYSHFSVELHLFAGSFPRRPGKLPRRGAFRWLTAAEFGNLPRPQATIRLMELLEETPGGEASPDSSPRRGRAGASPVRRVGGPPGSARAPWRAP